jgi:hypothetical protein
MSFFWMESLPNMLRPSMNAATPRPITDSGKSDNGGQS